MIRLSREQVRRVDAICIEEYGLPGIVLMENAARSAAEVAMQLLNGLGRRATVLCGGGNNGGDGLAIARHLHNRGIHVDVLTAWSKPLTGDASVNWDIVQKMSLPVRSAFNADGQVARENLETLDGSDLLIDAMYGTGLSVRPRGNFDDLLMSIAGWLPTILAVDLPSGLDCDTGEPLGDACVRATKTVTFVAEKLGFANPRAREFTGDVVVGDIGCPREVIDHISQM